MNACDKNRRHLNALKNTSSVICDYVLMTASPQGEA